MKKILSIVVPTYNMENYLQKCLSSLIIEEKMHLYEVLVINDGSKDNSLKIAKSFEIMYPNTFRTIDKKNGNYGSCINRGLQEAKGKYFKVLDADDSFDNSIFNSFIDFLLIQDADMLVSDFTIVDIKNNNKQVIEYSLPVGLEFEFEYFAKKNVPYMWMHAITHKTAKLHAINYTQQEGISYTDKEYVFYPVAVSQKVKYFPFPLYLYIQGRDGQTIDDSIWAKNYWMEIKAIMKLVSLYELHKYNVSQAGITFMRDQLILYISSIYNAFLLRYRRQLNLSELVTFDKELETASIEAYKMVENVTESPGFYYIKYWRSKKTLNINRFLLKRLTFRIFFYIKKFFNF